MMEIQTYHNSNSNWSPFFIHSVMSACLSVGEYVDFHQQKSGSLAERSPRSHLLGEGMRNLTLIRLKQFLGTGH